MKKRIASVILALCVLAPFLPVRARAEVEATSGECGSINWNFEKSSGTLTFSAKNTKASVPGFENNNWRNLAYWKYAPIAQNIKIENGVEDISGFAFYEDPFINSVSIPNTVESIGVSTFSSMSLSRVEIPYGVTSIGKNAFYCVKIAYIPSSVTAIGEYAFHDAEVIYFGGTEGAWNQLCAPNKIHFSDYTQIIYDSTGIPVATVNDADTLQRLVNENIYTRVRLTGGVDFQNSTLTVPSGHILDLDLNSNCITASGSLPVITVEGKLFVEDSTAGSVPIINADDSVTYFSGSIHTSNADVNVKQAAVVMRGKSYFKLDSGTVESTHGTAIVTEGTESGKSPVVYISGGYVKALDSGVGLWDRDGAATEVRIYGGVLYSQNGTTVSGGDYEENYTWVYLVGGTLISQSEDADRSPCGIYVPRKGSVDCRWGSIHAKGGIGILTRGGYLTARGDVTPGTDNPWNRYLHIDADKNIVLDQRGTALYGNDFRYTLYYTQKNIIGEPTVLCADGYELVKTENNSGANVSVTNYNTEYTFKKTGHTVTFDSQGGDAVSPATVNDGGKVTKPADPNKTGYTFDGWYTGTDWTTQWNFGTDTVTGDITLYAKWTPITYTVTFNPGEGQVTPASGETGTDGKLASLPTPTRQCYDFQYWHMSGGDTPITTDTVFTENTTVYAKWNVAHTEEEISAVPATCTADGQTAGKRCSVCGVVITEQKKIPALGHKWVSDGTGTETITKEPTCTEDGEKTITGGSKCSRCNQESSDTKTTVISAAGHKWNEWTTTKEATATEAGTRARECSVCHEKQTETIPATGADKPDKPTDPDMPAQPKTYTITFNPNGGTVSPTSAVTNTDGKVTMPTPARSGCTFDGWYTAASGGTKVDSGSTFTASATVYAHWTQTPTTPTETRYRIYTPGGVSGGSYEVSHSSAAEDTRVTIEFTPRSGYELDRLTVTNLDTGRSVSLTERYSDEYYFTMPASSVEVDISFSRVYPGNVYFDVVPPRAKPGPTAWYYRNRHIYHVTDGQVPDSAPITRDMLISVLYNLTDESLLDTPSDIGSETNNSHTWAVSSGIIPDIYASGLWGLDKALSREQLALMVFQYAKYAGRGASQSAAISHYSDYSQVRPIARGAMSWTIATGLMDGPTLSPWAGVTCGQTGELLYRFQTTVP